MSKFFKILFRIGTSQEMARQIKSDPVKREKSIRFGILSIILSIFAFACSCLMLLFGSIQDSALLIFLMIIIIALGVAGPVILLIDSLIYCITQLTINKKWVTWLAVVVLVLAFAGSIFMILHGFNTI